MKKYCVLLVTVVMLLVSSSVALAAGYLLNTESGKYHFDSCRTIKHHNASKFVPISSPAEAKAQGYVPCKVCNPY